MCARATCRATSIPSRYFQYVRSGDERPLAAVLEHNRLDLLSLALLTARAAQLLEEGADAAQTAREAYGLGCLYLRAGRLPDARACFCARRVADGTRLIHARRQRRCGALAVLARRSRHYEQAAAAWRRILALRRVPAAFPAGGERSAGRSSRAPRTGSSSGARPGATVAAVRHQWVARDRRSASSDTPRPEARRSEVRRDRPGQTTFSLF